MRIKKLKDVDYNVTRKLFNDVFDMSEDINFVQAWRRRVQEKSVGCWYDKSTLVGAAIVTDDNKLEYIYVHPEFQGQGIGSRLLNHLLSSSTSIHLIPVDDQDVMDWYYRFGFKISSQKHRRIVLVKHSYRLRC